MPKHRQPTPAARRARPALVTAGALTVLFTATGVALAATTPAPDAASPPFASPTAAAATATSSAPTTSAPETAAGTADADADAASPSPASDSTDAASPTATDSAAPQGDGGTWLSGASGDGAADGALGAWRGEAVGIVGTWADQGDNQTQLWSIAPGGEVADFDGAIDIAPGGLQDGDTWAAAADGAYDARWRQSLTRMAELRTGKGTTFIRPFHEFNLAGWNWSVSPDDAEDFKAAWARYRAVQRETFPAAKLVYGVNVTSSGTDLDWRTTWPGAGQADILGVDTYNGWPTITSTAEFKSHLDVRGADGIPIGLNAYSEQATEWGVPLAVPEWSGRAEMGDEPAYVTGMVDWFAEHAGNGPGQLAYEILFNAPQDDGNFQLFTAASRMPTSAQAYVDAVHATADGPGAAVPPTVTATDAPRGTGATATAPTGPTSTASATAAPSQDPTPAAVETEPAPADPVDQADVDALVARLEVLIDRLQRT